MLLAAREERFCRFCSEEFPDWKDSLTPSDLKPSTPIMAVSVRGKVHKLRVKPGPEGKEDFKRQVRQLLGYDDTMEFDVIFECKTPHSGECVQDSNGGWLHRSCPCSNVGMPIRQDTLHTLVRLRQCVQRVLSCRL